MLPYIIALLYMVGIMVAYYVTKPFKNKKFLYCALLILPIVFLCSFKKLSVGNDTSTYYDYYRFFASNKIGTERSGVEKGFGIFCGIFGHMKIPFTLFLLICYSIVYFPIVLLMNKLTKYPEMVAYCLFLFQFLNFTISALRQSIAIGICLFGLYILITNWSKRKSLFKILKTLIFVFFVFISYWFHRSAIIFSAIAFVFLAYDIIRIKPLIFCLVCLLAAMVSQYVYGFIFSVIQKSFTYDPPSSGSFLDVGFSTYFMIAIVVLFDFSLREKVVNKYEIVALKVTPKQITSKNKTINGMIENVKANSSLEYDSSFNNMFLMILAIAAFLNCLLNSAEVFGRIITYFTFSLGFVLSAMLDKIKSRKVVFVTSIFIFIALIVYFYVGSYRSGYLHMFPYEIGFYL